MLALRHETHLWGLALLINLELPGPVVLAGNSRCYTSLVLMDLGTFFLFQRGDTYVFA